jgi:hypothetical protein
LPFVLVLGRIERYSNAVDIFFGRLVAGFLGLGEMVDPFLYFTLCFSPMCSTQL